MHDLAGETRHEAVWAEEEAVEEGEASEAIQQAGGEEEAQQATERAHERRSGGGQGVCQGWGERGRERASERVRGERGMCLICQE